MYTPTDKDRQTALDWLLNELGEEIDEGYHIHGHLPMNIEEVLQLMNKYAAWNLREFCKDLHPIIEEWEDSNEHKYGGVEVSELFESEIIAKFK